MGHRTIRHTITRNGIYYVRFRLPGNKYFRKSLETDSHTQAQLLMSFASPVIPLVQRGTIQPDHFGKRLSEYGNTTLNPVGLYYLSQDNAPQAHRGGVRLQGGPAGPLVHRVKQQNGIVLLLSN